MRLKYALIFLSGFFSCMFLFYVYLNAGNFMHSGFTEFWDEIPFGTGLVSLNGNAPSDRVSEDDIIVFDDMVILRITNATLSNYADSGSMKPVFDEGANGIRVVPESENDVNAGDIISYKFGKLLVVHRVVRKGIDEDGVYFVVQGDNNILSDGKIRFADIEYVTVGVIW